MRNIITGVSFARDITEPVEVTDPDARWGWFNTGLNVRPASSKEDAYATARRIANKRQTSVQIYANTGDGWRQVDVVAKPDRELCWWWPERDAPATGVDGQGCNNTAVLSIGARENWHLCESCAALPRFRRMRRNRWIGPAPTD